MAINAGSVVAFMELDTSRFTSGLSSAGQQMKQFMNSNNSAEARIQSLGGAMNTVGKTATKGLTIPLVGVGTAATKMSMDFGAQMSKVKAISGATGDDFNKLREQAIKLGADTNFSASEAAGGMENLASAGFSVNEIMQAMPGMLDLAAAGDVSIADASDIASGALRGFGMEADKTSHVADVLAKTAADTNAGITDTGEAMKYIAPVAHSLGISFEDTAAAIGLLSNANIKGSQAGTTLRSALTNLASPTKQASKVMQELGMNFFDAHGKMLPLGQVIQQLQDKTKGLTEQQKASVMETLFGKEAMSGMLALVDQGPDKFNKLTKGLKNCDGAGHEMATTMQKNLKGAIESMKGSLETLGIRVGDVLAPGIKKAANFVAALANAFNKLPRPMQTIIVYAGVMAAAFGPTMIIFSKIITSTATVVGAMGKIGDATKAMGKAFKDLKSAASIFAKLPGLIKPNVLITIGIIAGLGLIVYEVVKHWDWFKKKAIALGQAIKGVFTSIGDALTTLITSFKKLPQVVVFMIDGIVKGIAEGIPKVIKSIINLGKRLLESFKDFFGIHSPSTVFTELGVFMMEGLVNGISGMASKIKNTISSIANSIKNTFKSLLGIHSPSVVFTEFGVNTGQGYINGLDKMQSPIKNRLVRLANGIKSLGSVRPKLDDIALSGAYEGHSGGSLSNIRNNSSKLLNFEPKINLYVTVADTGEKGTAKLTNEVKSMAKSSLKNGLVDFFMNDVIRD
ncbi:phage tail tape measure protein [Clostridium sp. JN-1]|uniref:phage tail tape measure protein n=1 Tax=Clostridium sp. JN-1 TaxID=2483110 RepID=UPI000F0B7AAD|nr:phage tail tape measure protein [Clostridium sp. JN-1]